MNSAGSYVFPSVLAIALHVAVVAALMFNWGSRPTLEVTEIKHYYIDSMVVPANPFRETMREKAEQSATAVARRQREADEQAAADRQRRMTRARADSARQAQLDQVVQEEAARLARIEQDVVSAPTESSEEVGAAESPVLSEEERLRMEQSLALAVLDEQEYRRAVTDDEKAMAYVAQIQREIEQKWSRPPSARTGMEVLLKVHLVPTGEVVDVAVLESSGNEAFDRSAILAVQKAERFMVPTDPRQFERNFREFEVLFRPEDLRL